MRRGLGEELARQRRASRRPQRRRHAFGQLRQQYPKHLPHGVPVVTVTVIREVS